MDTCSPCRDWGWADELQDLLLEVMSLDLVGHRDPPTSIVSISRGCSCPPPIVRFRNPRYSPLRLAITGLIPFRGMLTAISSPRLITVIILLLQNLFFQLLHSSNELEHHPAHILILTDGVDGRVVESTQGLATSGFGTQVKEAI